MRIGFKLIFALLLLATVAWRLGARWERAASDGLAGLGQTHFRDDATRSTTFRVPDDRWLSFEVARNATDVRLLTTAVVREAPPPNYSRFAMRPGWRYVLQYEVLGLEGQRLRGGEYCFRADVNQYQNSETGEIYAAGFFADSELIPTQTDTLQIPLRDLDALVSQFRVRLKGKHPDIVEIVTRAHCRQQRPHYNKPHAWHRLSRQRREMLCRSSVYPPQLLAPREIKWMLRWQWSQSAPMGVEGKDFVSRQMYTIENIKDIEVRPDPLPVGVIAGSGLKTTVPVPEAPGLVTLEFETVEQPKDEPLALEASWFGEELAERSRQRVVLSQPIETLDMAVAGGLIEIATNGRVAVRAKWRTDNRRDLLDYADKLGLPPPSDDVATLDITAEPKLALHYVVDAGRPLSFQISHLNNLPTPICISLRELREDDASIVDLFKYGIASGATAPTYLNLGDHSAGDAQVAWEMLDDHGSPVASGSLASNESVSEYDCILAGGVMLRISEPAACYVAAPAEVSRLQLSAEQPLLVCVYSRPPQAPRRTAVPEDYSPFSRQCSLNRTWFPLRADSHYQLRREARTVDVQLQPRPPQDDQDLLAGRYVWEDFRPSGIWNGRFLLSPHDVHTPLRDEVLPVVYWEFSVNQEHDTHLLAPLGRQAVVPRLIYDAEHPTKLTILLNGKTYFERALRAKRGEVELPGLPAQPGSQRLEIRAEENVRVFLTHLQCETAPRYIKRLAQSATGRRLRFTVAKRGDDPETLLLRLYQQDRSSPRTRLRVEVQSIPRHNAVSTPSWTVSSRLFDLRSANSRDNSSDTLVLGNRQESVSAGPACYIPLGEDVPPGEYSVLVELLDSNDDYLVLYRTTPGVASRLDVDSDAQPRRDKSK